jgi:catechol 2,3-dioxygenase-like lactoylglutathione lyase family enzyme
VTVTRIQLVSVPVSDQERAKAFYTETLGFDLVADNPFGDQRWVQVAPKGAETGVTLVTWFETMPPGSTKGLVLETDDVDASYQELSARGVRFNGPVEEQFWGRFATFDDPDGNGWVLQQAPAPSATA